MSEIDLQQFCSDDVFRSYLMQPFTAGEYSYATNGHIMVRVAKRDGVGAPKKEFKWDAPFEGLDTTTFSILEHLPLPPASTPEKVDCRDCDGRGTEHDCPDCECECETCDGSGKILDKTDVSTTIRGSIFNLHYVRMILALPNVEISDKPMTEPKSDHERILFRFAGGVGALMAMRCKYGEHVEIEKVMEAAE